jgi:glycosyltransferase involved in cell wall biosynthesis
MCGADLKNLRQIAHSLVLDIDDPVHLSSSNFLNFSLGRWWRFRSTAQACAAILAASSGLVTEARAFNPNVHFVPLCADPDAYAMAARPRQAGSPLRLLWIGSKSTFKYLQGVRTHLEAIGKACANVELTVVGHSQLQLKNMVVHNVAWSAEADRAALDACHVGLVPLWNDRWTRSKAALKPLQYLASGIPFLGSPVGVLKDIAEGGRNAILADQPEQWAEAVRLLEFDEALRQRMGESGVEFVKQKHSAEVLAQKIGDVFHGISKTGSARMAA